MAVTGIQLHSVSNSIVVGPVVYFLIFRVIKKKKKHVKFFQLNSLHLFELVSVFDALSVSSADFHKAAPYVVTGSVDQTVKVWECR